jgi:ketosteroid isomerase-like protein
MPRCAPEMPAARIAIIYWGQSMFKLIFFCLLFVLAPARAEDPSFSELTATSEKIARAYYDYYIQLDFEKLAPLLAENASFFDPTAQQIFGAQQTNGKSAVLENFKTAYANITHMEIRDANAYFSGQYGIFCGQLDWSFKSGPEHHLIHIKKMPLTVTIKVENGQVTEHRDYADYRVFSRQYEAQTSKQ